MSIDKRPYRAGAIAEAIIESRITVVESRKTKAELKQEIASLRARVNEKEAVMDRSVGVRRRIAKIESKSLRKYWNG